MASDFEGFSVPDFIHYIYFPVLKGSSNNIALNCFMKNYTWYLAMQYLDSKLVLFIDPTDFTSISFSHIVLKDGWLNYSFYFRDQEKGRPACTGRQSDRQKIFEFLKTPSLASRQASLGLKIIDDDLEWTELYSAQFTSPSPSR